MRHWHDWLSGDKLLADCCMECGVGILDEGHLGDNIGSPEGGGVKDDVMTDWPLSIFSAL
jgi:hypothetical protein